MGPETLADLDPPRLRARRLQSAGLPPHGSLRVPWVGAFAAVAGLAAAAALLLWLQPGGGWAGSVFALLALSALACMRLPRRVLGHGLTAVLTGVALGAAGTAWQLGWGLAAPGLPIMGLLVCMLCAGVGWRSGAFLTAVSALALLGLWWLQPAAPPGPGPAPGMLLGNHLIALAAGLGGGVMISRVVAHYMRSAHEREDRFRRLLTLASDAYWEIDARYCLVAAARQAGDPRPTSLSEGLGQMPWELPQFGCDADVLDALLADLDTREPFRDVAARWTTRDGQTRSYLLSGEPRFDARGIFTGYWGVARDITEVESAHDALLATETRYQELFAHIPSPLVLHRGGHVLDANPAALHLFGHPDLPSMVGTDLLSAFESGDSRERARRRIESLHGQDLGTALPVADFRLVVDGRQVTVRGTSVRVDAEGGPAVLAIFVDDTERLAAEDAVRRSEALLSHLVATSPDLITLTEMASGRYAMVNHAFERVTGWTVAEAVGRTADELGIWGAAEREPFMALLRREGTVSDVPTQFTVKNGRPVSMLVSAARFVMDRREYLVINARDVTERERERLEREAILANASVGIAVTRGQRFVLVNRYFEQALGWQPGTLLGQPGRVVWNSDEEYTEVGRAVGPALTRGEATELERPLRRRDGSAMLAHLRARAIDPGRIDSGTVWIMEDVTERRQFEQALARARDDAEAASRAKSAFLANTSHELRTPLNGMIGLARLAQDEQIGEERRRQYLEQIAQSAQSLAAIISDILDLSKIEAGKLLIESTAFDLGAELQSLQRTYATLAAAHGLELRWQVAPELAGPVLGDPLRLRQILANFLTNAIKFTPSGWVGLVARRQGSNGTVRIEVQDSGPGLDEATAARLFKPFTQADQSTTRRFGGTGLGLSISHELATLMGGAVGVQSRVGEGSSFWLELPLPEGPPLPAPPRAAPPEAGDALRGSRVLMVEDNPVNMMIAVAMLERWGVEVAQAHDGREAVAAVQRAAADGRPFHTVLMDVQMPMMSGHEATRLLRAEGHRLPIVALTAAALVTEREAALAAGMNDFLTKPIDADKLQAALLRWCASRENTA
jgi:PAS domain S-box-containing protein